MFEREPHQMELAATHASGAEEWHCPTCGRRLLIQVSPVFRKLVLVSGDNHTPHSGGKNIQPEDLPFSSAAPSPLDMADETVVRSEADVPEPLLPWFAAIKQIERDAS